MITNFKRCKCNLQLNMAMLNQNQTTSSEVILESQGVKMVNQNPQNVIDTNFGKTIFGEKTPTMGNIAKGWSVTDMLERWNLVYTGDWKAGDATTELFAINAPWGMMSNSSIKMAFSYFSFWHADISFHVKISSTRFNQGKMIVFWVPVLDKQYIERYIITNLARIFTLPHVVIDATTMNDATISVPFNHYKSALRSNLLGHHDNAEILDNSLGYLVGYNWNTLQAFTGTGGCTSDVKISIYAKFQNPTVGPPTRKVNIAPTLHYLLHNPRLQLSSSQIKDGYKSLRKYIMKRDLSMLQSDMSKFYPDQKELAHLISEIQSAVDKLPEVRKVNYQSAILGGLVGSIVPSLGNVLSESVSSSVSNFQKIIDRINPINIVANLIEGDRDFPNKNAQENSFIRHAFGHTANGRQIGHFQRMDHDPTLLFQQSIGDLKTTEDEMNLAHLATIPTPLSTFEWKDDDAVGKVLFSTLIAPCDWVDNFTVGSCINPAGYHYVSLPFTFWSGTIKFLVKIAVNAMATGRLQIEVQPGYIQEATDIDEGAAIYSYIIDLGNESHDYSFETPYETTTKRKFLPVAINDDVTDISKYESMYAGVVTIRVLNPLRTMCGSPTSATINLLAGGGSSYSLSGYGYGSTDYIYSAETMPDSQIILPNGIKPTPYPQVVNPDYPTSVKKVNYQAGDSDPDNMEAEAAKMDAVADAPPVANSDQDKGSGEIIGIVKTGDSTNINFKRGMENLNLLDHIKAFSMVANISPAGIKQPSANISGIPVWYTMFANCPGQIFPNSYSPNWETSGPSSSNWLTQYSAGNLGYWNNYYVFWSGDLRYKILLSGQSSTMNKWRAYAFYTPYVFNNTIQIHGTPEDYNSVLVKIANMLPMPPYNANLVAHNSGSTDGTATYTMQNIATPASNDPLTSYPTVTPKLVYGTDSTKKAGSMAAPMGNMYPLASCDQNAPYMEIEVPFKTIYDRLLTPRPECEIENALAYRNVIAGSVFVVIVSTDAVVRDENEVPPTVQIWQAAGDNFRYQTKLGPPTLWTSGASTSVGGASDGGFYAPFPNAGSSVPAPP